MKKRAKPKPAKPVKKKVKPKPRRAIKPWERAPKPKKPEAAKKEKAKKPEKPKPAVKRAGLRTIDHILYVETAVDKLLRMVREKGKVRMKEAAKAFGVPKEQIEEWADILEEHKLILVHYPPLGDAIIKVRKEAKK